MQSAPEHEQFGVGGEEFPEGVPELAAGLDPALDLLDPGGRDSLDALFAVAHKGREPNRVAFLWSAVAGRLATAAVGEGAGQQKWQTAAGALPAKAAQNTQPDSSGGQEPE